jgi:hypothetical protein
VKKWKRHTDKESATFISRRPSLGRGDLRGNLHHQSNTQRGESMPFLQVGDFKHPVMGKGSREEDRH